MGPTACLCWEISASVSVLAPRWKVKVSVTHGVCTSVCPCVSSILIPRAAQYCTDGASSSLLYLFILVG